MTMLLDAPRLSQTHSQRELLSERLKLETPRASAEADWDRMHPKAPNPWRGAQEALAALKKQSDDLDEAQRRAEFAEIVHQYEVACAAIRSPDLDVAKVRALEREMAEIPSGFDCVRSGAHIRTGQPNSEADAAQREAAKTWLALDTARGNLAGQISNAAGRRVEMERQHPFLVDLGAQLDAASTK